MIPDELLALPNPCTSPGERERDTHSPARFAKALSAVRCRTSEKSRFIDRTEAKRILQEGEAFTWSSSQGITVCVRV